jgi:hypothetical protein
MDGLSYTTIIEFAEPLTRRRGSAFFVRRQSVAGDFPVGFRGGVFWWFAGEFWFELAADGWLALKRSSRRFRAASRFEPVGLRFTGFIESWIFCCLTSRRSQPPLALSVPLSRFTPRVGGGSAFYVRQQVSREILPSWFRCGDFDFSDCCRRESRG